MEPATLENRTRLSPGNEISSDVSVNNSKCRRCSYCIQICPAKAIKLEKDSIKIISERCILCGSCITLCPQQAIVYKSGLSNVAKLLSEQKQIIACLDPAF